jgi:hypothetical protein
MVQAHDIEKALRHILPLEMQGQVKQLAQIIADRANKRSTTSTATQQVNSSEGMQDAFLHLAGETINASGAVLTFGEGSQIGDVRVRDLAGRDVVNFNIYINHSALEKTSTTQGEAGEGFLNTNQKVGADVQPWNPFRIDQIESLTKDQEFYQKWATLTSIGFVVSFILCTGIYFTSTNLNQPTKTIPNPIETYFFMNSALPSLTCGIMQFFLIRNIHPKAIYWIWINIGLITILKTITKWPFQFALISLLPYLLTIFAFQLILGPIVLYSLRLIKWIGHDALTAQE